MVKQIPGEVGERLVEQAKHTGQQAKQAPVTIFQRAVGEKTAEEKKEEKQQRESGIEPPPSGGQQAQQQVRSQTDLRRQEIETEKRVKHKKMQKILHRKLFEEAERVRQMREEQERLKKMKEEEEKRSKQAKVTQELQEKEKEEALAVQVAKRARGAGEFGPRPPK